MQTDKGRLKLRQGIFEGAERVKGTEGRVSVGNRMWVLGIVRVGGETREPGDSAPNAHGVCSRLSHLCDEGRHTPRADLEQ